MHEGSFESAEEDDRPIYVANSGKDGGLREDWREAAKVIAHIEGGIALSRLQRKRDGFEQPSDDEFQPGFVMVGRRMSLSAIAETTTGIIEHGQVFVAWSDMVGDDPKALRRFDEAFLGSWDSAAEFAEQVMGQLGPLSADASKEDQQFHMLLLASELAEELQRRGVICAIPNRRGGVWVFRRPQDESPQADLEAAEGGGHA
jgi:hypothetical protein